MEIISEILNGKKIYPKLNDKYINLSIAIDMKESYKILFNEKDYQGFINRLKSDKKYKKEIISKLNDHFNLRNYILITNSTYDIWYYARFLENTQKQYTLLYVENVCQLNPTHFYENYVDLFGNEIVFSE